MDGSLVYDEAALLNLFGSKARLGTELFTFHEPSLSELRFVSNPDFVDDEDSDETSEVLFAATFSECEVYRGQPDLVGLPLTITIEITRPPFTDETKFRYLALFAEARTVCLLPKSTPPSRLTKEALVECAELFNALVFRMVALSTWWARFGFYPLPKLDLQEYFSSSSNQYCLKERVQELRTCLNVSA